MKEEKSEVRSQPRTSTVQGQKSEGERQESGARSQESEGTQSLIPNPQSPIPPLNLAAAERTVTLTDSHGHRFVHHFRPPKAEDWLEYERAVKPTLIFREDEVETRAGTRAASETLWRKLILRVEGYGEQESGVRSQESELRRILLEHRVRAVAGLDQVQAAEDQDVLGDSETAAVKLEAWWNGEFFPALIHRFKRPLVEHELRFREALERRAIVTRRIAGQKRPKNQPIESRSLPVLPTLVALYDELIVSVEGYRMGIQDSAPLRPERGGGFRIQESMDCPHKSAAVRALFAGESIEIEDFPIPESRVPNPEAVDA